MKKIKNPVFSRFGGIIQLLFFPGARVHNTYARTILLLYYPPTGTRTRGVDRRGAHLPLLSISLQHTRARTFSYLSLRIAVFGLSLTHAHPCCPSFGRVWRRAHTHPNWWQRALYIIGTARIIFVPSAAHVITRIILPTTRGPCCVFIYVRTTTQHYSSRTVEFGQFPGVFCDVRQLPSKQSLQRPKGRFFFGSTRVTAVGRARCVFHRSFGN